MLILWISMCLPNFMKFHHCLFKILINQNVAYGRTNVRTVYPLTNTVCRGYKNSLHIHTNTPTLLLKRQKLYIPYISHIPGVTPVVPMKWTTMQNLQLRNPDIWTASSEFSTYRLFEQRRFRRACASAQYRQNLRCSLIQAVSQEEPSDRKPDPWPLWMSGHAQLKFVMTECSKTQIRLTGLISYTSAIATIVLYWACGCAFVVCI